MLISSYTKKINSDDIEITVNKNKNSGKGLKKIVGFIISGFGVYILMMFILYSGIKYDKNSASIISLIISIIGAVFGSRILSRYSWSIIFVTLLLIIGFSALLIAVLK